LMNSTLQNLENCLTHCFPIRTFPTRMKIDLNFEIQYCLLFFLVAFLTQVVVWQGQFGVWLHF
jgi:hypothetical protein